jgi:hypothetical protein
VCGQEEAIRCQAVCRLWSMMLKGEMRLGGERGGGGGGKTPCESKPCDNLTHLVVC